MGLKAVPSPGLTHGGAPEKTVERAFFFLPMYSASALLVIVASLAALAGADRPAFNWYGTSRVFFIKPLLPCVPLTLLR